MKKPENEVRKIFVKFRVNEKELLQLKKLQQQSTERNVSNYIRKVALQKPIVVKYRNQSADEILTDLIKMKNELNAIGNNFNQAVHKLHTLDRIPEFRTWVMLYESTKQSVEKKVEEIKERMNQIYQHWLQK